MQRAPTPPTILIVEDDPDLREVLSVMLDGQGMPSVAFGEPVELIDYLRQGNDADLLLTDLELPQMSGLDLSRLIARDRPGLPVVMMTGDPVRLEEAIAIGAVPLVKPFTERQLMAVIKDALEASPRRS